MGGQSGLRFLGGYWFLQKKCPCAVPPGLRCEFLEFGFPTLKRGANLHCAYGAVARRLLLQRSIEPMVVFWIFRHE